MTVWPRARTAGWVAAGLALFVLCLAPALAVGRWQPGGVTFDPAWQYESRLIGPSQQFEVRLRLVSPRNQQGYSIGFRRAVDSNEASMARFLRASARLPGRDGVPRPYLEFSIILRRR